MIDLDELIAEARLWAPCAMYPGFQKSLIDGLANALESVRAERDAALARIAEAAKLHRRDSPGLGGEWCQSDGLKWPCPTAVALGLNEGENENE